MGDGAIGQMEMAIERDRKGCWDVTIGKMLFSNLSYFPCPTLIFLFIIES
jgi:hypothetical protein